MKCDGFLLLRKKHLCNSLGCELLSSLYSCNIFCYLKEGMTDDRFSDGDLWHTFSKLNEVNLSLHGNKVSVFNDTISFQVKIRILENFIHHHELDRITILKDFLVKLAMILISVILCQHLNDLHNMVSQYVPNYQCMKLQTQASVKDLLKVQDKWILI